MNMQLNLIASERKKEHIANGCLHIPGWIPPGGQEILLKNVRQWWQMAGSYQPELSPGIRLGHPIACLGHRWEADVKAYSPGTVAIPELIKMISAKALAEIETDGYQDYIPQTALINWFHPGSSLGMHRDRSEHVDLRNSGSPLITISLGCEGTFRLGNDGNPKSKIRDIQVRSGDLVLMYGRCRNNFHGVLGITPGTDPPNLNMRSSGRISLTIRQVYPF